MRGSTFGTPQVAASPGTSGGNAGLGYYNVMAAPYNAKGDGVTDDTAAITAAIAAAGAGTVFFPATSASYICGLLTLTNPGVTLFIAAGATLKCKANLGNGSNSWITMAAAYQTITGAGASSIIDGNADNQTTQFLQSISMGQYSSSSDNCEVSHLHIIHWSGYGVVLGSNKAKVAWCTFDTPAANGLSSNCGRIGGLNIGLVGAVIDHCWVDVTIGSQDAFGSVGYTTQHCDYCQVTNNTIVNCPRFAIEMWGVCNFLVVSQNTITTNNVSGYGGISCANTGRTSIVGNTINLLSNSTSAIECSAQYINVEANNIEGNGTASVGIVNYGNGVDLVIQGNVIRNLTWAGIATDQGDTNTVIADNILDTCGRSGDYAMHVGASVNGSGGATCIIADNIFYNSPGSDIGVTKMPNTVIHDNIHIGTVGSDIVSTAGNDYLAIHDELFLAGTGILLTQVPTHWRAHNNLPATWDGGTYGLGMPAAPLLQAQLGADVTMTTAGTFYDGPTVTPGAAHQVLLMATLTVLATATAGKVTAKLWDGTTVIASTETDQVVSTPTSITLTGFVAASSANAYKMSVTSTQASNAIKAAAPDSGAGNNASTITALVVA